MKAKSESEARTEIVTIASQAIAGLPVRHADFTRQALSRFLVERGPMANLYLEFESSFHVSASLDITCQSGRYDGHIEFTSTVSVSSGQRTLAQSQAAHNLMGRVLEAAHTIQAAIDSMGTVMRDSMETVMRDKKEK